LVPLDFGMLTLSRGDLLAASKEHGMNTNSKSPATIDPIVRGTVVDDVIERITNLII
jgi:hypothetical protein